MGIVHRSKTIPLVAVVLALQKEPRKHDGDRAAWVVCQVFSPIPGPFFPINSDPGEVAGVSA